MARGLLLAVGLSSLACILRPGTNPDCAWPPEEPRILVLANAADRRHLVIDAELIEELVDRYRFHFPNQHPPCESKLIETVAPTHAVAIRDVAQADARVSDRGLNLPVLVSVAGLFVWTVLALTRRIERRFSDERVPHIISLGIASIALSVLFVLVGEFWTSVRWCLLSARRTCSRIPVGRPGKAAHRRGLIPKSLEHDEELQHAEKTFGA
jgi:hypothetical protein